MQYGESYIGRSFKLKRAHHINEKSTLTAGMIGTSLGVDSKAARLLLLFATPERDIETWVEEGNLLLAESAGTRTEESPAPKPQAERKFKRLREYQPKLTAVKSSNLKAVGLIEGEGLVVEFVNGTAYIYPGVDAETHAELMAADSIGKAYNAKIKSNPAYQAIKLEA